jgi:uncharacterized membrane protein YphA (DoxX/SURF4 family)
MVIGTRLFLGAIFFTSGMGKLTHGDFPGLIGPVWLAERLEQFGLAPWAQFVGWSQVVIGLLLLSQRFATLGAVMLVPMITNILVITISLGWRGTPYVNAVLLLMNLFLLAADWKKLRWLVFDGGDGPRLRQPSGVSVSLLAAAGVAIGVAAPALYPLHRMLTFIAAAFAVGLFAIAAPRYYKSPA